MWAFFKSVSDNARYPAQHPPTHPLSNIMVFGIWAGVAAAAAAARRHGPHGPHGPHGAHKTPCPVTPWGPLAPTGVTLSGRGPTHPPSPDSGRYPKTNKNAHYASFELHSWEILDARRCGGDNQGRQRFYGPFTHKTKATPHPPFKDVSLHIHFRLGSQACMRDHSHWIRVESLHRVQV